MPQAQTKTVSQLEKQKFVLLKKFNEAKTIGQEKSLENKIAKLNIQIQEQKHFEYLAM